MTSQIEQIVAENLDFILKQQQKDGSFISLSFTDPEKIKNPKKYSSVFPTALILSCIGQRNNNPDAEKIRKNALKFLIRQKTEYWSFNYWTRESNQAKKMPYPDDLDDTFCSLSAIMKASPDLIDGNALAKITMLLTAVEKEEGGPYRTWFVDSGVAKEWQDIDLAVNSNVAYFLSFHGIRLKSIEKLVEQAIRRKEYISPYYPSPYQVVYFISRFYKSRNKKEIINFLLKNKKANHSWGNPLETALAISALLNLKYPAKKLTDSIKYLLKNKHLTTKTYAFCIDPALNKITHYAGSPAITAAFCVEALQKFLEIKNDKKNLNTDSVIKEGKRIHEKITKELLVRFSTADSLVKSHGLEVMKKIFSKDHLKQITLLPYYFKNSLGKNSDKITDELMIKLGSANAYGWIAYTIYDDLLDNEASPKFLPLANICLRELTSTFSGLFPDDKNFKFLFSEILDKIEMANSWETSCCRADVSEKILTIPSELPAYQAYSKLADRSIGHALGPIAILYSLGYDYNSPQMRSLISFFHHYIIARQLNDDAHDWEDDLKKGNLSPVVVDVLKEWGENKKSSKIHLQKELSDLQQIFWNKTIKKTCKEVLNHIEAARKELKKLSILEKQIYLENLLLPTESSAQKALGEQKQALNFINSYSESIRK